VSSVWQARISVFKLKKTNFRQASFNWKHHHWAKAGAIPVLAAVLLQHVNDVFTGMVRLSPF